MYLRIVIQSTNDVVLPSQVAKVYVLRAIAQPLIHKAHYHMCILKVLVFNLENDNLLYGIVVQQKAHKQA